MNKQDIKAIQKTVAALVKNLPSRNQDIVSRRFGLGSGKRETLESIGKSYGITRERVRQIEEFSLRQLSKVLPSGGDVAKHIETVNLIVEKEGGAMAEHNLFKIMSGSDTPTAEHAALSFFLELTGKLYKYEEDEQFQAFWALSQKDAQRFLDGGRSLAQSFDKSASVVPSASLASFASQQSVRFGDGILSGKPLATLLSLSKSIGENIFGEVGLTSWANIRPRGVRDKAYLVLQKQGQPKHFTEIANLINTASFAHKRQVNIQTVHNELIKDPRFVLVGRGLYGLSEWGYRAGTVKDVLTDILKSAKKPLTRAELVAQVMDVRMVKENTILLNLQDSKSFVKREDGTYDLRRA